MTVEAQNAEQALKWAEKHLSEAGYRFTSVKHVRSVPWSTVWRINCAKEIFYLKCPALVFSKEGDILSLLNLHSPDGIVKLIADNGPGGAFITADAGFSLRDILSVSPFPGIAVRALSSYAKAQCAVSEKVPDMLASGMPDYRVNLLTHKYAELLDSGLLQEADGASRNNIEKLRKGIPKLEKLCRVLKTGCIPDSIEHGDFTDNNIFVLDDVPRVADFGEAVVSHPFLSVSRFAAGMGRVHGSHGNVIAETAVKAYLEQWKAYGTSAELRETMNIVTEISPVKEALALARLWNGMHRKSMERQSGLMLLSLNAFVGKVSEHDE